MRSRQLTEAECLFYDLHPETIDAFILIDDDAGIIMGYLEFNRAFRGMDCNSCTGACGRFGSLYISPPYRNQGHFQRFVGEAKDLAGYDKLYTSSLAPRQQLLSVQRNFDLPDGPESPPAPNVMQSQRRIATLIGAMQAGGLADD